MWASGSILSWRFEPLLEGDELQALQQDIDHTLPGVVPRRPLRRDPQVARDLRAAGQVGDIGYDLGRVLGLDHDRVLEGLGVFLTGRPYERDPAGGHRLQADEAERLVAAVGPGGGGPGGTDRGG